MLHSVTLQLLTHSVVSNSLRPHGLQHARHPSPSPTSRACLNSCPSSQCWHPNISSCYPLLLTPWIFPSTRVFSNKSVLHVRWPKYWSFSFSISCSNKYLGLISFRIDWLDLLAVQRLSRVFSNTMVQKHRFFGAQPSLWSNSHIHTWLLEKSQHKRDMLFKFLVNTFQTSLVVQFLRIHLPMQGTLVQSLV